MESQSIPREVLEAPFAPEAIKSRPGSYGSVLCYLEGHTVIGRLNEAFEGAWSFEIVSHEVLEDEVLVLGKFRAEAAGVVKMAFGSSKITRHDQTAKTVSVGDDLKAAATDALKKAATLLGVGLQLYGTSAATDRGAVHVSARPTEAHGSEIPESAARDTRNGNAPVPRASNGGNGSSRITNKQISAVFSIARHRGMTNAEVRDLAKEMFDRNLDYLTKADGSRLIETLLGQ